MDVTRVPRASHLSICAHVLKAISTNRRDADAPAVSETAGQDRPVFSTASDLVVVHATITDRGGAYVTGLTRDAFAILEDGRPQKTELFTREDAPVTIGLLIDSSGSMQPNRERVIAAAAAFAEASHPSDDVFALAFNDSVRAALPPPAAGGDRRCISDRSWPTIRRGEGRLAVTSHVWTEVDWVTHAGVTLR